MKKRLLVGISGASGAPLAVELLRQLRAFPDIEVHLLVSQCGALTLGHECGMTAADLDGLVARRYENDDYGAAPASGSFPTMGMVIVPCSMKTLAGIVSGYCETLLLRAADVTLKERRPLVLVPRECPFSTIHLRNLTAASELGARIVMPVPAYYNHPQTIDDVNRQIVGKILGQLGLDTDLVRPWEGL
jgi:polyprenyl P-hydroxybenzoate/phenylacrylic acid decarboxylase-like protein